MKHLFIINPTTYELKGQVEAIKDEINAFFKANAYMSRDIHITRWERDAAVFIRRYAAQSEELLRVHMMGGSGTLFEVINGIAGLPNLQLAVYPFGRLNAFLRYFGEDKLHLFSSIRSQVFSNVVALDAIRSGHNYGICYGMVGLEAQTNRDGFEIKLRNPHIREDICMVLAALQLVFSQQTPSRHHSITMDGQNLDGNYTSILVANTSRYGMKMIPAPDANPGDGLLDVYLVKNISKKSILRIMIDYLNGKYHKYPKIIQHHRFKNISIITEGTTCFSVDGETFYENRVDFEAAPYAIDFVCPFGVEMRDP